MTDKRVIGRARSVRNSSSGKRRRPAGDVAGVSVDPTTDNPRPVTVEIEGRRCRYELAWTVLDNQPVVTDLRVVPRDGEAITPLDLKINLNRIAAVVASVDTASASEAWTGAQRAFEDAAAQSGLPRSGYEWLGSYRPLDARDLYRPAENNPASKRRRGRPKLPDEHYHAVAELILHLQGTKTRSLYRDFQDRWPADRPAVTTVRDWIAEAKRRKLLPQDALRSTPTTTERTGQ
ncbi:hypothetical protein [Mycolicibacterium sp. 120270]|uniref:hypothetical protein n=1 Tax=Mycolicibacterium sp. 120270 TaxID=3090600 RepID=UPI00299F4B5C|nr:hypothetical protein [Mycolicibacterium sp. 120270]MDX1886530.1 hypothetical protein [Mycolicibacterium sp. 120270]